MRVIIIILILFIQTSGYGQSTVSNSYYPIEKSDIDEIKDQKSYAYMQTIDQLLRNENQKQKSFDTPANKETSGWLGKFLKSKEASVIGWCFVILILLYVAYSFIKSEGIIINRKKLKRVVEESYEEEISPFTNYEQIISNAVSKNDYRYAVKYQFLYVLSKLNAKEYIHLESGKTNYDYMHKLPSNLRTDFTPLLHIYEYVWYGEKTPSLEQYREIANLFDKFSTQI